MCTSHMRAHLMSASPSPTRPALPAAHVPYSHHNLSAFLKRERAGRLPFNPRKPKGQLSDSELFSVAGVEPACVFDHTQREFDHTHV